MLFPDNRVFLGFNLFNLPFWQVVVVFNFFLVLSTNVINCNETDAFAKGVK